MLIVWENGLTLKFDRDPSMVIIYLPTKFERDWEKTEK